MLPNAFACERDLRAFSYRYLDIFNNILNNDVEADTVV